MMRCHNYDENPTKMIDFILNHEKRRIVLNRILVKNLTHGNVLITDSTYIKQLATQHFQQYALPVTNSVPINTK